MPTSTDARGRSSPAGSILSRSAENRYFVHLGDATEPIAWMLNDGHKHVPKYIHRTLRHAVSHLRDGGWTFYVTWRLDTLPEVGPNVVAIVMGDEWARRPAYADQIAATFKCYGTSLPFGSRTPWQPSYFQLLLWAKYFRTQIHRLPSTLDHLISRVRRWLVGHGPTAPVYDFPLGYGNQIDLSPRPITDRPFDLFFAGSVEHGRKPKWSPGSWIQNPKSVSRYRMIDALSDLARHKSAPRIKLSTTSEFAWNAVFCGKTNTEGLLDAETYSAHMMNSKICLVPRGTSPETFRFFEALRYGCIPVTEALPSRWFYNDAPALVVDDWSELGDLVPDLLSTPERLETLHADALDWWHRVCSEAAVGHYVADTLTRASSR